VDGLGDFIGERLLSRLPGRVLGGGNYHGRRSWTEGEEERTDARQNIREGVQIGGLFCLIQARLLLHIDRNSNRASGGRNSESFKVSSLGGVVQTAGVTSGLQTAAFHFHSQIRPYFPRAINKLCSSRSKTLGPQEVRFDIRISRISVTH
jgi:hypothetical protein